MSDGRTITVSLIWTGFILAMARGWVGSIGEWIGARVRPDAPSSASVSGAGAPTPGAQGQSGLAPGAGPGTGSGGGGGGSW